MIHWQFLKRNRLGHVNQFLRPFGQFLARCPFCLHLRQRPSFIHRSRSSWVNFFSSKFATCAGFLGTSIFPISIGTGPPYLLTWMILQLNVPLVFCKQTLLFQRHASSRKESDFLWCIRPSKSNVLVPGSSDQFDPLFRCPEYLGGFC